jgi:hypothetical protein
MPTEKTVGRFFSEGRDQNQASARDASAAFRLHPQQGRKIPQLVKNSPASFTPILQCSKTTKSNISSKR